MAEKRRIIPYQEALRLVEKSPYGVHLSMGVVRIVRIDEPFTLIEVDGGMNGVDADAGDYIGLHPKGGYPFIVDRRVGE